MRGSVLLVTFAVTLLQSVSGKECAIKRSGSFDPPVLEIISVRHIHLHSYLYIFVLDDS